MFKFARIAIELFEDGVAISEVVVRMVLPNLDNAQRLVQSREAILLLKSVLELVSKQMLDLSESQASDLRLQMDQVVPKLCEIATTNEKKIQCRDFGSTYVNVIETLCVICGIKDWNQLVLNRLKCPEKILNQAKSVAMRLRELDSEFSVVPMTSVLMKFCCVVNWDDAFKNSLIYDSHWMSLVWQCTKHPSQLDQIVCNGIDHPDLLKSFMSSRSVHTDMAAEEPADQTEIYNPANYSRIGEVMANVTKAAENLQVCWAIQC